MLSCPKCRSTEIKQQELRISGVFSAAFDWDRNGFTARICRNCGYTEFYADAGARKGRSDDTEAQR